MSAPPDLAFVACIETGVLERQALLLFESIRAHAGGYADCPIYALAPRAGLGVGRATRNRLDALKVEYIDTVLNTECVEYGSTNRVVAAAHIEGTTKHEILVVLDSDTLVLREPEAFRLPQDVDAAVRPVDYKGICTAGPEDPFDGYWRKLCETCGAGYDEIPWIQSYVDDVRVKASYNGGLVVVRRDRGILRRWSEFFLASVRAGLRPRAEALAFRSSTGAVAAPASRMWGSNQAALSLALWSTTTTRRVLTLEPAYNYPLHAHEALGKRRATDFDRLVHVHYHWLFEPDAIADAAITSPASTLSADKLAWLRARTPFRPLEVPLTSRRSRGTSAVSEMSAHQKPVIVVGMHRSGTSLTASILGSAGLHIGDNLVPAGPGNAEGHFEDLDFVGLHRAALAAHGHDPEGWDEVLLDAMPDVFEAKAHGLIEARAARPLWGWKDPRTAVFLPFWERLLPAARFVFVYRKPWEVIDSLYRRGDGRFRQDPAAAARLWSLYNRAILESHARLRDRAVLFHLEDIAAHSNEFVEQVSRAFGLRLDPPADVFKPNLLRRGESLADWRALSESVLSPEIDLLKRLDDAAHGLAGDAPTPAPAEPPEGALLRQWAALRAAERVGGEATEAEAPRPPEHLRLYIPSQGAYSEFIALGDVLAPDGQMRDHMFLFYYDGSAPLRLDVGEAIGLVELEAVTIRSRETGATISWSGQSLDAAPFRLVHAIRTSGRRDETFGFLSLNNDAQLYLDLPEKSRFEGACQIDIAVGFRALTDEPVRRAAAALLGELTAAAAANAVVRAQLADADVGQRQATLRQHELTIQQAATIDDLNRRLADASLALKCREAAMAALERRLLEADDRWQSAGARLESSEAALAEQRERTVRHGLELDRLREALARSERHVADISSVLATLRESRAYRLGRLITDPWRRLASAGAAPVNGGNRLTSVSSSDLAWLARTPFFDEEFYLASNPDVRATRVDPRMHYLRYGAAEGRDPSPWFDTSFYLAEYPDVAAAGVNPLVHYVTKGAQEGRLPKHLAILRS
jgi:hypothetical protein